MAKKLGKSLSKFRREYGHLYSVKKDDARIINLSHPEITIQETKTPVETGKNQNIQYGKAQKKSKRKTKVEREEMIRCLYCRTIVKKSLLNRHLLNAHKIDTSLNCPPPQIAPLKGEVGCPYCFRATLEHSLEKHLQKCERRLKAKNVAMKPLDVCPCCWKVVQYFQQHMIKKHPDKI